MGTRVVREGARGSLPARLLVVALAIMAGTAAGAAPAAADECDGVWVVVDATRLGGSVRTLCAPGSPSSGLDALTRAGVRYEFVPRIPGMVCTLDGLPDPCNGAPADAYWSYWHADAGGSWTYSNRGAGNRTPARGTVEGWAFGSGQQPGRQPPAAAPAPSPTPTPTPTDTPTPSPTSSPSPSPTASPTPGTPASPSPSPTRTPGDAGEAPRSSDATTGETSSDDAGRNAVDDGPDGRDDGSDDREGGDLDEPTAAPEEDAPVGDGPGDEAPGTDGEDDLDTAADEQGTVDDTVALGDVPGGGGGVPVGAVAGGVLIAGLAGAGIWRSRQRDEG